MEEKIGSNRQHKLILQNRGKGNITGICDVVSFDENAVVLDTDMGLLTIKGKELHVSRLTLEKGEVDIEGTIDSMVYSSNEALRKSGESWSQAVGSYWPMIPSGCSAWLSATAPSGQGWRIFCIGFMRGW